MNVVDLYTGLRLLETRVAELERKLEEAREEIDALTADAAARSVEEDDRHV